MNHDAPCDDRTHTFPCSHYLGLVEPARSSRVRTCDEHGEFLVLTGCLVCAFLERTGSADAPRPVPFSPQGCRETPDRAGGPHTMTENAPEPAPRPHPITAADRSAVAAQALACAADQLLDVATSEDPQPLYAGRATDVIWTLAPWQLAAVAAWLDARADLYR